MTIPFYQTHSSTNAPNYVDYERSKYWSLAIRNPPARCGGYSYGFSGDCHVYGTSGLNPYVPIQVNRCDRAYIIPTGGSNDMACCSSFLCEGRYFSVDHQGSTGPMGYTAIKRPTRQITDYCGCTITGILHPSYFLTAGGDRIFEQSNAICSWFPIGRCPGQVMPIGSGVGISPHVKPIMVSCQSCTNTWNHGVCRATEIVDTTFGGQWMGITINYPQCHCNNATTTDRICENWSLERFENLIDCDCCNMIPCTKRLCVLCYAHRCPERCINSCNGSSSGCRYRVMNFVQPDENDSDMFYHIDTSISQNIRSGSYTCYLFGTISCCCYQINCCGGAIAQHAIAHVAINSKCSTAFAEHCVCKAVAIPAPCMQTDGYVDVALYKKVCQIADNQVFLTGNAWIGDLLVGNPCCCCQTSHSILSVNLDTGCACKIRLQVPNNTTTAFLSDAIFTTRGTWVVMGAQPSLNPNCDQDNFFRAGVSNLFIQEYSCDFSTLCGTIKMVTNGSNGVFYCCQCIFAGWNVAQLGYDQYDDSVIISAGRWAGACGKSSCGFCNSLHPGYTDVWKLPSCMSITCQYICQQCRYNATPCCTTYTCCCFNSGYACLRIAPGSAVFGGPAVCMMNVCCNCMCVQVSKFTVCPLGTTGSFLCSSMSSYNQYLCRFGWRCPNYCVCCVCLCASGMSANCSKRFRCTEANSCGGIGCQNIPCRNYISQHSGETHYVAYCMEC